MRGAYPTYVVHTLASVEQLTYLRCGVSRHRTILPQASVTPVASTFDFSGAFFDAWGQLATQRPSLKQMLLVTLAPNQIEP